MFTTIDRSRVTERDAMLLCAKEDLKTHFIGIDGIVDELIDAIRVWYVAPELITRPVIVGLWGMTGVGKTDLVRRLVAALNLDDHFVEIEPSNTDETHGRSSIISRLEGSGALEGIPTVLLVDEVQRLRTIDERGAAVTTTRYQDLWQLLSDGRLPRIEPADIEDIESNLLYQKSKRRIGRWWALRLKRDLRLADSITDLSELRVGEVRELVAEKRANKEIYRPLDCRKSLVIVAGNLDDAYGVAEQGAEPDVDADTFADHCDRVTMIDVKNALLRRFRPEQEARFGNTHLVYPSLRRADFARLIARELDRITTTFSASFGIHIVIEQSIHDLVYNNGVFPVQGVRPVLSTIADVVETNLSGFILAALDAGQDEIALSHDPQRGVLVAVIGDGAVEVPFVGRLDRIRECSQEDHQACVSVHESGHALLHAVLLGLAPKEVTCRVVSSNTGGFTSGHHVYATRATLIDRLRIQLAGGLAEVEVFGAENQSTGAASDRVAATKLVIQQVRQHGFDDRFLPDFQLDQPFDLDRAGTTQVVHRMFAEVSAEVAATLRSQRSALIDLAEALAAAGRLTGEQVATVLARHGIEARVEAGTFELVPPYAELLAVAAGSVPVR